MGKLKVRVCAHALAFCFIATASEQTIADLPSETAAATTLVRKTIVFLGDSLTAGYGVRPEQSYPALIAEKIRAANLSYEVVNAGISGDTSADGLARIDWLLQRKIDVLVVALGANDGLRGLAPSNLKANLEAIIEKAKSKNPEMRIVIAGMQMPPNLGADYAMKFQEVFAEVAQKNNAVLIPFLLESVGGHRDLNQSDSIHPTAAGQKVIAETVWRGLEPILRGE